VSIRYYNRSRAFEKLLSDKNFGSDEDSSELQLSARHWRRQHQTISILNVIGARERDKGARTKKSHVTASNARTVGSDILGDYHKHAASEQQILGGQGTTYPVGSDFSRAIEDTE
jgi:hypothetical protein